MTFEFPRNGIVPSLREIAESVVGAGTLTEREKLILAAIEGVPRKPHYFEVPSLPCDCLGEILATSTTAAADLRTVVYAHLTQAAIQLFAACVPASEIVMVHTGRSDTLRVGGERGIDVFRVAWDFSGPDVLPSIEITAEWLAWPPRRLV